jgi:hypothetical protein
MSASKYVDGACIRSQSLLTFLSIKSSLTCPCRVIVIYEVAWMPKGDTYYMHGWRYDCLL